MLYSVATVGVAAAVVALVAIHSRGGAAARTAGLVRVTYWAGRGRCEPLRCILAAAGVLVEQRFLDKSSGKAQLARLREEGVLAYDQVPLVEIDGLCLVQGAATAGYLGRRFGLLSTDPREAYTVEQVYAASQDARACLLTFPFADYPEAPTAATIARVLSECKGPKGLLGRSV